MDIVTHQRLHSLPIYKLLIWVNAEWQVNDRYGWNPVIHRST